MINNKDDAAPSSCFADGRSIHSVLPTPGDRTHFRVGDTVATRTWKVESLHWFCGQGITLQADGKTSWHKWQILEHDKVVGLAMAWRGAPEWQFFCFKWWQHMRHGAPNGYCKSRSQRMSPAFQGGDEFHGQQLGDVNCGKSGWKCYIDDIITLTGSRCRISWALDSGEISIDNYKLISDKSMDISQ